MKVVRIKDTNRNETTNHCPHSPASDYTLCGLEQDGDEEIGLSVGKLIDGKITCPDCIEYIDMCRKIKEEDINRYRYNRRIESIVKKVSHYIGYKLCPDCDGTGEIEKDDTYYGQKIVASKEQCDKCKGRGYLYK